MPDWSYHSLFKAILFRMPAPVARRLTLQAVSTLGNLPGGGGLIDFMAKMKPAAQLKYDALALSFPGRVGLAAGLCIDSGTVKAFQNFGFGFIEAGPVTLNALSIDESLERDEQQSSIIAADAPVNAGLERFVTTVLPASSTKLPLFVRIAHIEGTKCSAAMNEARSIIERLPAWVEAVTLDSRWCLAQWSREELQSYLAAICAAFRRVILVIAPDAEEDLCTRLLESATNAGIGAVLVAGGIKLSDGKTKRIYGQPCRNDTLRTVQYVRAHFRDTHIIAGEAIVDPQDAVDLLRAGADMVALYSGLVFAGPGLAKRINELITSSLPQLLVKPTSTAPWCSPYAWQHVLSSGWIGFALVGLGLIVTGSSAITVALTTVILPYDEKFLGMTRAAMISLNTNLLPFLSHDRVTYAGAGMSGGLMFAALSFFGARNGQRWAYIAARNSCAFGFSSFLLFLGFHYLDPLHALVTMMLFPFFVWGVLKAPPEKSMRSSNNRNDKDWLNGLYGQFWFVCIGLGLVLAGITICKVGTSTVFVNEDLMFMHTTAHNLLVNNDHLLPAIAHDRAGFGGSLVTVGIAVLLTALHGFRQGEGWVWWMLLISGLPGFVATLAIHYAIGYTNMFHLLPAYIASAMFVGGLALSYRYLCVQPGPDAIEQTVDS